MNKTKIPNIPMRNDFINKTNNYYHYHHYYYNNTHNNNHSCGCNKSELLEDELYYINNYIQMIIIKKNIREETTKAMVYDTILNYCKELKKRNVFIIDMLVKNIINQNTSLYLYKQK